MDNFVINASIIQNANPCEGVVSWTARTPANTAFIEVVWAASLSLFVAIRNTSGANAISTSPDGITWTPRAQPTTGSPFWQSLTWSSSLSLFVAVASTGTNRVMTSPDGINWTQRSASNASTWKKVAWIPTLNIFVAGANAWGVNLNVMTSPDGINWTTRNSASFQSRGFAWSPTLGLIVAVSANTPFIYTSPDGITWTSRSVSNCVGITDIAWSPYLAMFVATCTGSATPGTVAFQRSTDGINWTSYSGGVSGGGFSYQTAICWAPEISTFVTLGFDEVTTKAVFSSKDGISFTQRTCPNPSNAWADLAWSPSLGIFAAVAGSGTNLAMTSNQCP